MVIACRLFSGLMLNGKYSKRFLPDGRNLVYVLDELALKAQNRHDPRFQNIKDLVEQPNAVDANGEKYPRLLDEAFLQRQGYDLLEFLGKFVKPVQLTNPPGIALVINKDDWPRVVEEYRVWVNVQDGARNIATPATGQLIRRLDMIGEAALEG